MKATNKVFELDRKEPCAIVMGGDEKGGYPSLLKICVQQFQIHLTGDLDLLNLSVVTGSVLYEVMKQRTE